MIIVNISGGLGNQMFQYAAARRLSYIHHTPLKLDLNQFNNQTERKFGLDKFQIKLDFATKEDVNFLVNSSLLQILPVIPSRFQPLYIKLLKLKYKFLVNEKHFHFDESILNTSKDAYLLGYFQSEKYFFDIKNIIRKEFICRFTQSEENKMILNKIKRTTSVSIHFRLTDRIYEKGKNEFHGVLDFSYYHKAISILSARIKKAVFFVFSDDPNWVKNHFKINHKLEYIDTNSSDQDYEDLRLISNCKYHIIANSTFSWWGAWLSENKDKIVIVTKKWFRNSSLNSQDLIPDSWLRL